MRLQDFQSDSYKNFLSGRYLSEGVRVTTGILLPVFLFSYLGLLETGIVISLGALCASVTDSPGPVHHRVNGMLFCTIIISIISVIVSYAAHTAWVLAILFLLFGFIFSMLTVYGQRSSSIGIAALLVMILTLQTPLSGSAIWKNSFLILSGSVWYLGFSVLLYKIRPYKLIQQALGDYIIDVADYLETRGQLYADSPSYDKTYQDLLQQQINVQNQQALISELLFKSRLVMKESTHTGRVLLKIYADVAELYESIMTTFQDYRLLHQQFDETGILDKFRIQILSIAHEIQTVGLAVKSGEVSVAGEEFVEGMNRLRVEFNELKNDELRGSNLDAFIVLGRILTNLGHLTEMTQGLHYYTTYDKKIKRPSKETSEHSNYSAVQDIRPAIFFNNLNLGSTVFRHSIRVSLALFMGYLITLYFSIGHNYWILLTIVVILKPAYSLTKKRNQDRLIGTLGGILIGVGILYLIQEKWALISLMVICMVIAYTFMRTRYFISVLFLTPYLVIFFFLLYPSTLQSILRDRIIDTTIGSAIAFVASLFLVPSWEHQGIKNFMTPMLKASSSYYSLLGRVFALNETINPNEFKTARKELLTNLANISDAFNRMLSEPRRFQKNMASIHRFVVLNHILSSHYATLSWMLNVKENKFRSAKLELLVKNTQSQFTQAINELNHDSHTELPARFIFDEVNEEMRALMKQRKLELAEGAGTTETRNRLVEMKPVLDQFQFIHTISSDIVKACRDFNK